MYLNGERFSEGERFQVSRDRHVVDRLSLLERLATDRRVLHVGFADHEEIVAAKESQSLWLHGRLLRSARECVGVDIDAKAVQAAQDRGIPDVHVLDVTQPPADHPVLGRDFDLVILGEVVEHIPDPVAFLQAVVRAVGRPGQQFVVTVPNAWNLTTLLGIPRGIEFINTDHRFWFTPYTLAKILTDAGLSVADVQLCDGFPAKPKTAKGKAFHLVTQRFPMLRPSVVGIANVP